jgi:small subunit ribosomal protein S16
MKLFKTKNNDIYAYELDGSQDHLIGDKTPITQEEADKKFAIWMSEKDAKVEAKKSGLANTAAQMKADAMKAETKRKESIAAKIEAKNTVVEEVAEEVAESTEEVADTAEAVAETPETSSEETSSEEATSEETATE